MPVIDHLLSSATVRQAIWKLWYPYLTRRLRKEDVLFLNYAFADEPPKVIPLTVADESNRGCIQLYQHVAEPVSFAHRHVLEVSCGHGGGAAFLSRTHRPASYVAMDLNAAGIAFCRKRRGVDGLTFVQGDALDLPFADGSFDVVLNVEASHCYPSFPIFLQEVARVLRPGGQFAYADFRFKSGMAAWERELAAAPLQMRHGRTINAEVLRGMDRNSDRSAKLIESHLPKFLHALGRDFAGVKGSRIYAALEQGEVSYRSYLFEKSAA